MVDQAEENSNSKSLYLMVKRLSKFLKYKNKSNTKFEGKRRPFKKQD